MSGAKPDMVYRFHLYPYEERKIRYNCSILDLYNRSIVATLNSDYINTELAKATFRKSTAGRKAGKRLDLT